MSDHTNDCQGIVLNRDHDVVNRGRGALMGLAVGDAMGAPAENLDAAQVQERFGQVRGFLTPDPRGTDDTEYAAFVGRLILRHGTSLGVDDLLAGYEAEIVGLDRIRGGGFSELGTMMNLRRGWMPPTSALHLHTASDGLAMRAAVHGVAAAGDTSVAERLLRVDASMCATDDGVEAGVLVAVAVASALAGATLEDALVEGLAHVNPDTWTAATVEFAMTLPGPEALLARVVNRRYPWTDLAPEAVAIGVWAALTCQGEPRLAIPDAIQLGRDADTTAALAGALTGAVRGEDGIPQQWRARIGPLEGRCLPSVAGVDIAGLAQELVVQGRDLGSGGGGSGRD